MPSCSSPLAGVLLYVVKHSRVDIYSVLSILDPYASRQVPQMEPNGPGYLNR